MVQTWLVSELNGPKLLRSLGIFILRSTFCCTKCCLTSPFVSTVNRSKRTGQHGNGSDLVLQAGGLIESSRLRQQSQPLMELDPPSYGRLLEDDNTKGRRPALSQPLVVSNHLMLDSPTLVGSCARSPYSDDSYLAPPDPLQAPEHLSPLSPHQQDLDLRPMPAVSLSMIGKEVD